MHILLTDVLSCPRCGPRFGLIVLADRMDDRRVAEGKLGCANCREEYTISGGVADLRFPVGTESVTGMASEPPADLAFRTAALLAVGDRPGTVLLLGTAPAMAREVARLLPAASVIAVAPDAGSDPVSSGNVSWLRLGASLPFRDRSMRAVALNGSFSPVLLDEVVRVLALGGNLVVDPAASGVSAELAARGLNILLEQEGVVVASPPLAR